MSVTIAVSPSDEEQQPETSEGKGLEVEGAARVFHDAGETKLLDPMSPELSNQASAAREYLDKHNLVEFTQLLVQSVTRLISVTSLRISRLLFRFYFPEPEPRPRPPPMTAEDERGLLASMLRG
ncbi:unnamed protein product [Symbiodinium natans]|uniref:Uncharacterized protein n=1 Tax=Symbiodinium natans TaxID=878477 RepID=A0A812UMM9_9DINO|nr:unnamed protein product [Symbiodinium natans]